MQIWVDAGACPKVFEAFLFRPALGVAVPLTLVATRSFRAPRSPYIKTLRVPAGFDVADNRIVDQVQSDDLVVTADIPLAAAVIEKGAHADAPSGELYTVNNVRERLAVRDFMDELRSTGVVTGGPSEFGRGDRKAFANALDRVLSKWKKR